MHGYADLAVGCRWERSRESLVEELGDAHEILLERYAARLHLRGEQQVRDEAQKAVCVTLDDFEVASVLLLELVLVFLDEFEVADDRGQRSAELVRDQSDQVVLEAVDFA